MIRHHEMLYADLADPVALLRRQGETQLGRFWGYAGGARTHELGADEAAPYSALMGASQALVAEEMLAAYPLARHRCLHGRRRGRGRLRRRRGGPRAAAGAPAVRPAGGRRPGAGAIRGAGLAGRAQAIAGDFLRDPLPEGADVVSLVRVLLRP